MANLSDFFPAGEVVTSISTPDTAEKNAYVLLVGGGGGGSTGKVRSYICPTATPTTVICINSTEGGPSLGRELYYGFGGGGGGVYVGNFDLIPGTPYPVVVGAGGASGCMNASCAGEPGGAGSNGGISRFGNCIVMGGGGAGTYCWCSKSPTVCTCFDEPFKYVHNKDGANAGSTGRFENEPTPNCYLRDGRCNSWSQDIGAVSSFRVNGIRSAGGGFFAQDYDAVFLGSPCPASIVNTAQDQFNLAKGYYVECNPTNDSWELKSTFFGLKLIPDTESTSYPNYIMYCCTPTTVDVPSLPAPVQTDITANPICITCYAMCYNYMPAVFWKLGVSRNQEKRFRAPFNCGTCPGASGIPCLCSTFDIGGNFNMMQPPVPNTGSGGFNNACIIEPTFTTTYGFTSTICNSVSCNYFGSFQGVSYPTNSDLRIQGNGDEGVVYIVYDCNLGAASSTPGAVDCTPVTGPQGYRSYRYTSSGSFTL